MLFRSRQGADFKRVLAQIKQRLGHTPVALQLQIGMEENFVGQVDLMTMKARYWDEADMGLIYREEDIPADMLAEAEEYRALMVEAAAESSEELMDKYLEGGELSIEEIKAGLRARTIAGEIVPAVCGSSQYLSKRKKSSGSTYVCTLWFYFKWKYNTKYSYKNTSH